MEIELLITRDTLVVVEDENNPADLSLVEEAAREGAWIIIHRPFAGNNRNIGYEVTRQMLEESGHPWPRPDEDAATIKKMLIALEAGRITEADFVDWVCLRVATA